MRKMKQFALVGLGLAALVGCGGDSPTRPLVTPTPTPAPLCPFAVIPEPVSGFPGLYTIRLDPPGDISTVSINGTSRPVERGAFVTAAGGDVVSACRTCGCSPAVVAR